MASSILHRVSVRIILVSVLTCTAPAFSQGPAAPAPAPGPAPGGSPGGGTGTPGGGRPSGQPTQQQPTRRDPSTDFEQARPVFLTGKVLMDDGSRPPVGVLIERLCGGTIRPEGYTDTKGNFSFQLGQNQHMMVDASQSSAASISPLGRSGMANSMGGMSGSDLNGCEIRAALPGFRSDVVMLAGRRAMDNPDVGTIVLHRLAKVEGYTFSGTSLNAPKEATKAYEKGSQAAKKKKWKDAEEQLRKAVETYPQYAVAWYELGTVYHQQNNIPQARDAYQNAAKADDKYVSPFAQLARIEGAAQKWPETAELSGKVLRLNPYFSPDMYFISAVANYNLKKLDVAEEHAREASKLDPQQRNPRIVQLLGVVLAHKAAYPEAAENLRTFLKKVPEGPEADSVKKQLAEVELRMSAVAPAQPVP